MSPEGPCPAALGAVAEEPPERWAPGAGPGGATQGREGKERQRGGAGEAGAEGRNAGGRAGRAGRDLGPGKGQGFRPAGQAPRRWRGRRLSRRGAGAAVAVPGAGPAPPSVPFPLPSLSPSFPPSLSLSPPSLPPSVPPRVPPAPPRPPPAAPRAAPRPAPAVRERRRRVTFPAAIRRSGGAGAPGHELRLGQRRAACRGAAASRRRPAGAAGRGGGGQRGHPRGGRGPEGRLGERGRRRRQARDALGVQQQRERQRRPRRRGRPHLQDLLPGPRAGEQSSRGRAAGAPRTLGTPAPGPSPVPGADPGDSRLESPAPAVRAPAAAVRGACGKRLGRTRAGAELWENSGILPCLPRTLGVLWHSRSLVHLWGTLHNTNFSGFC